MDPRQCLAAALTLAAAVCAPSASPPGEDATWVGTITTEGNVTKVVNESGSVWGGTATLVEETSIGVETGPEEYMLGAVGGVWADDEYIFVVDRQVLTVRVYDLEGRHVRDLGRAGQGPGEFMVPGPVTGDDRGRIFVLDAVGRFAVFDRTDGSVDTWPAADAWCCNWRTFATPSGNVWSSSLVRDAPLRTNRFGFREFGPDGAVGGIVYPDEMGFEPLTFEITIGDRTESVSVPWGPRFAWAGTANGAIVSGATGRYRFAIQEADGSVIVVERRGWEPIRIAEGEAEWQRRYRIASIRAQTRNETVNWDGDGMPATKPAFSAFLPTDTGAVWLQREGAGERLDNCVEDPIAAGNEAAAEAPCWRSQTLIDAFDADGRFLGSFQAPPGSSPLATSWHIRDDQVVGVTEDDLGTIRVKRWRLMIPR